MKTFELGSAPIGAGVTILDLLSVDHEKRLARYRVKYDCCGSIGELSLAGIRSRKAEKSTKCQFCYDRMKRKPDREPFEDYDIPTPSWAVPPSVRRMK